MCVRNEYIHVTVLAVQKIRCFLNCVLEQFNAISRVDVNNLMSQGVSGWGMPDASELQRRCLACALRVEIKCN